MTDDQEKALDALMSVECKMDADGCDEGPWCAARALVAEAFSLEVKKPEQEGDKSD